MATPTSRSPRERIDKRALFVDMGYDPHPGQWEVHNSSAPRRIVACGVRWGKTLAAAMEGVAAALQPADRSVGWIVAPTYDLADRVFREIQVVAYRHLRHRIVAMKEAERRLILRNMSGGTSEIRAKSADNPVSLLGEGLDWLVVDEASRMKPVIWQSHLSQRLIDKKGWALLISTPKGKGYFYDLFRRGQGDDPDFKSWNYPSWTNPLLDPEVIEQERGRLPQQVFRQEIAAEFTEGAGQVFRKVRECATGSFEPVRNLYYSGGLDLAKLHDWTVLVIMSAYRQVVYFDRWTHIDWTLQAKRIEKTSWDYERPEIFVDSTGLGEPIFEALKLANLYVKPYPLTVQSKSDLITNLSLMLEQGMITLPRYELAPVLINELEAFEYSVTESGTLKTGAPGGEHDDCVIALALAAWRWRPRKHGECGVLR